MEQATPQNPPDFEALFKRYAQAKKRRDQWQTHWQQCYDYALPQREEALNATTNINQTTGQNIGSGQKKQDHLFDATAQDAVEQLASSLMAALTPPWGRWFELSAGHGVEARLSPEQWQHLSLALETANQALDHHIKQSNLQVELHQSYLDLVTIGTASLLLEEAPLGAPSAFSFKNLPIGELTLDGANNGVLDYSFRLHRLELSEFLERFNHHVDGQIDGLDDPAARPLVLEVVYPKKSATGFQDGFDHAVLYAGVDMEPQMDQAILLSHQHYRHSPFINFRWMKVPGEAYGRSPVMKALPDIKTANKIVELVLKNATIAVTGVWQAEDDGVLNPATVKLVPGAIIPKASGSSGLTPLQAPGQFDVSELVLTDVRGRIRHALLVDRLAPLQEPNMTATEVLERAGEMDRLLGASYGRLQSELLYPLARRAVHLLQKRGEIPDFVVDGREIAINITSPLARNHRREEAFALMQYLEQIGQLGEAAMRLIDAEKTARWLAEALQIPQDIFTKLPESLPPNQPIGQPTERAL